MTEEIKKIKNYYYKNLYKLKELEKWEQIDSRFDDKDDDNKIGKLLPDDLQGVCKDCDNFGKTCNLMSGFSHSSDLTRLFNINKLDKSNIVTAGKEVPFMFICENPGKDYFNKSTSYFGKSINFRNLNNWFSKKSDFLNKDLSKFSNKSDDAYAFSFAHLMLKYKLSNVYITNSVKCKPNSSNNFGKYDNELNKHCIEKFLLKEIELFKPTTIICFGKNAYNNVIQYKHKFENITIINVLHPSIRGKTLSKYSLKYKDNIYFKTSKLTNSKMKILMTNWYNTFDKLFLND